MRIWVIELEDAFLLFAGNLLTLYLPITDPQVT